jgi:glycosyltransferase 2 family protein
VPKTQAPKRSPGASASSGVSAEPTEHAVRDSKGRWSWVKPLVALAVVALAAFLLYRTLSRYDYEELVASVTSIPPWRLAAAFGFAAMSYLCLTGFDFLALHYVGHRLPYRKVALASFTSLSLGHNIGLAALSSGAIRYRFYSRWGLETEDVAKLIIFCGITVGLGLATLGGLALALAPDLAADLTGLARPIVFALAALCFAVPIAWIALAATVKRTLCFRRWSIALPHPMLAAAQTVLGTVNFGFVAACLHQALSGIGEASYFSVASVYVIANVAALVSHVPGGLGVIESVVTHLLPEARTIGAVLVFRFVYFLVPLVLGGTLFALTELWLKRRNAESAQSAQVSADEGQAWQEGSRASADRAAGFQASV